MQLHLDCFMRRLIAGLPSPASGASSVASMASISPPTSIPISPSLRAKVPGRTVVVHIASLYPQRPPLCLWRLQAPVLLSLIDAKFCNICRHLHIALLVRVDWGIHPTSPQSHLPSPLLSTSPQGGC